MDLPAGAPSRRTAGIRKGEGTLALDLKEAREGLRTARRTGLDRLDIGYQTKALPTRVELIFTGAGGHLPLTRYTYRRCRSGLGEMRSGFPATDVVPGGLLEDVEHRRPLDAGRPGQAGAASWRATQGREVHRVLGRADADHLHARAAGISSTPRGASAASCPDVSARWGRSESRPGWCPDSSRADIPWPLEGDARGRILYAGGCSPAPSMTNPSLLTVLKSRRIWLLMALGFASGLPLWLTGSHAVRVDEERGGEPQDHRHLQRWWRMPYTFKVAVGAADGPLHPALPGPAARLDAAHAGAADWAPSPPWGSVNPKDGPHRAWRAMAVLVAFLSASQDIVADAWRTDILPLEERGLGNPVRHRATGWACSSRADVALILSDILGWPKTYYVHGRAHVRGRGGHAAGPGAPERAASAQPAWRRW